MSHKHIHAHHDHAHHPQGNEQRLFFALSLTFGFAVVEAITGVLSGSLALLGDAGHMVTDSFSMVLAVFAIRLAKRPPSARLSYGLGRLETLAALLNVFFMFGIVISLGIAAINRFANPSQIEGGVVSGVAFLGLLINLAVAWFLMRGEQTLNMRGALLHVIGDLLGSVAALASGLVIMWTGFMLIDPILSLLINALILFSSLRLLKEVVHALLEGVPFRFSLPDIGILLAGIPNVLSVHDVHIWTISSDKTALSAHLRLASMDHWASVFANAQEQLQKQGISHITLQPELENQGPSYEEADSCGPSYRESFLPKST